MAKISFKNWTKPAIARFHEEHPTKESLSEEGITPLQILVAVLDHTPGFREIPEVCDGEWARIFKLLSSLYNTKRIRGIRPRHEAIMQAAIRFDKIPKPAEGGYSLNYLFVSLREEAVKIAADEYEVNTVKAPSFQDLGIEF